MFTLTGLLPPLRTGVMNPTENGEEKMEKERKTGSMEEKWKERRGSDRGKGKGKRRKV